MIDGGFYAFFIPVARTIAGFCVGVMLGICGGWAAITFNNFIGFPWSLEVHRNIYIVGIGLGAGVGAYLGWVNLSERWYLVVGTVALVLLGGLVGVYIGYEYGKVVEPSYLGRRYTVDNYLHWFAPLGAIIVATILGLIGEKRRHMH